MEQRSLVQTSFLSLCLFLSACVCVPVIMFKQGAERVCINACVISVGIITDWLELSDVTAEAGSLCCHWGNRGVLPVVTHTLDYPSGSTVREQRFEYTFTLL